MAKLISLTENYEFLRTYRRGKSCGGKFLVLYFFKRRNKTKRLGITVTKKVGKACIRNRTRRLIYENMRLFFPHISLGYDIVVVARPSITNSNFFEIQHELDRLLKKAGILPPSGI